LTSATAHGATQLLGEIVKTVDESTQVPLTDLTYQAIYTGFLALAAPLLGIVLCAATIIAALRRDPATLGRAVVGLVVAGLGGALYLVLAQLLVGVDNWLAHGIVEVTGHDLTDGLTEIAAGFERIGGTGSPEGAIAANMLILVLMLVMLLAGIVLWFVLVLRKIAILVVVAFAPLLVAGYLWAPTRPWVRRATEVLVALVFTKTAIYALFGIGLALLSRGTGQSLSDFVGTVVLLCGACFTPLVMLRLVHFAADTQIAGEMMVTLRGGIHPVVRHLPSPAGHHGLHGSGTSRDNSGDHDVGSGSSDGSLGGRGELARHLGQAPPPAHPAPAGAADTGAAPRGAMGAETTGSTAAAGTTKGMGASAGPAGVLAAAAAGTVATAGAVARQAPEVAASMNAGTSRDRPESEPPVAEPPPNDRRPDPPAAPIIGPVVRPIRPEGDDAR
jgi:hypothetical protein